MKKMSLLLLVASFGFMGCATKIHYGLEKSLYQRPEKTKLVAALDQIQDLRTEEEHDGTFSLTKGYDYSKDSAFKKDISAQVTDITAKHLRHANIFSAVEVQELVNFSVEDQAQVDALLAQGIDIVIQADLHHFYGYQSGAKSAAMSSFFGLAGVMTEALVNKKLVGGRATLGDVKIFDLDSKSLLWQGDLDYEFEEKDTFYDGGPMYAIQALKKVNEKLAQQVSEVVHDR